MTTHAAARPPAEPDRWAATPIAVTVDVALFTIRHGRLCVLLVERSGEPFAGSWALPGGFVGAAEDAEAAAQRELAEETGIGIDADGHLEQLRTYSAPDRDPRLRVVSIAYVAFRPDLPLPHAGSDAAAARFWPVDELDLGSGAGLEVAFDHARIVDDALERVRAKLEYTTLATSFIDEPFTLSELRRVYETVWGVELDASLFRRRILNQPGFVVPVDRVRPRPSGKRGRPAVLYERGPAATLHPAILRRDPTDDER